uniref:syntaxin-5-like n=1 Tax=Myxine glutinosa TaxID=7769 RepID=UPI00358EAE6B
MYARRRHGVSTSSSDSVCLGPVQTHTLTVSNNSSVSRTDCTLRSPPLLTERTTCGRDRTQEFLAVCKSFDRQQNGLQEIRSPRLSSQKESPFSSLAKRIGRDLCKTSSKLEKLELLAQDASFVEEKALEIDQLTSIIKQDISSLNKQIVGLQDSMKLKNTRMGRHAWSHRNAVVVILQSKLASMSSKCKSLLETRTENLKQEQHRKEQFFNHSSLAASPAADYRRDWNAVGQVNIDMDSGAARQMQGQITQVADRESVGSMKTMESTIVELGSIFNQLAYMVKEQEELIQRIDAGVEDSHLNVDAAHTEIVKYLQFVTANRRFMLKVFLVLIVIFVAFAIVLT